MLRRTAIGLTVFMLLTAAGCGVSRTTATLALVVSAAQVAVDTLSAGGTIDQQTATAVNKYLDQVLGFVQFASTESQSTDPPALKVAKIAQAGAAIAKPNLPSSVGARIVNVVDAVARAVATYLAAVSPPAPKSLTATQAKPADMMAKPGDKKALNQIRDQAATLRTRVR